MLWWVINIVLICIITGYNCVGSLSAIVHWPKTIMLFLSYFILNHNVILFFSNILNLLLCNIFEHNVSLHMKKSTTFQSSIIHNIMQPLKYGSLLGVGWLWWGRYWLRDINHIDSVILQKWTNVTNQCERLAWTRTWRLLYFYCWYHFEMRPCRV